jgi:uncharacterized protein involved in type VI secretion and phage assembly
MQQINLYQPILRKQEKVFSAKTLLQGNLLVLGGLLLLSAYTLFQTRQLQEQLAEATQQRNDRLQRLETLRMQYPQRVKDQSLQQQVEQLREQVQENQQLLSAVENYEDSPTSGFSAHLAGLARQDLRSLWLTRIMVRGQRQLALEGSALAAQDVPALIQRLGTEPVFSGTAFQRVEIQANKETGQVDFFLNTTRQAEGAR